MSQDNQGAGVSETQEAIDSAAQTHSTLPQIVPAQFLEVLSKDHEQGFYHLEDCQDLRQGSVIQIVQELLDRTTPGRGALETNSTFHD